MVLSQRLLSIGAAAALGLALLLIGLAPRCSAAAPVRFFSPASPWNKAVPAGAPMDPSSRQLISNLTGEVKAELTSDEGPSISTRSYSVPIYTVGAAQPPVSVRLRSGFAAPALREAFGAVPLPENAVPAAGNDHHLVVWQPSTDRLWEFWHLVRSGGEWQAGWGGAIEDVSAASGFAGPSSWPGADSSWGASGSGLSIVGGVITLEDLRAGRIEHALALSLPGIQKAEFAAPAVRTDGTSPSSLALQEGAHLRLKPSLDLESLNLPPLTLELARAAQTYGIFVRDCAHNITFYAQDPIPTGTEPYKGLGGFFEGQYPARLLAFFPWKDLQVLKAEAN
jgi:hypothetical protein